MDPFKDLNKLRVTEENRFKMAFDMYSDLVVSIAGTKDIPQNKHQDLVDMSFAHVDAFIQNYLKRHAK